MTSTRLIVLLDLLTVSLIMLLKIVGPIEVGLSWVLAVFWVHVTATIAFR